MKKIKNYIAIALVAALTMTTAAYAEEDSTESSNSIKEAIMKGLSSFTYKVYEWPENLTVGKLSFKIAEALYTIRENSGEAVLWNDSTIKEEMFNFYSSTDWAEFEGMYETVEISNTCDAVLTDEVSAYEGLMDAAAETYGFSLYKEIFKAMAQARFNEYKDVYEQAKKDGKINGTGDDQFDLFHIDGSWIDGGSTPVEDAKAPTTTPTPSPAPTSAAASATTAGPTAMPDSDEKSRYELMLEKGNYTVAQSIEIAAKTFSEILEDAVCPSPYSTDDLLSVVQCFEYGGKSSAITVRYTSSPYQLSNYNGFISFGEYFDNEVYAGSTAEMAESSDTDYDAIIEKYAKVIAYGKTRSSSDEYGKYKYSDQKFYQKVFENYKCAGGGTMDYGELPDDMKEILRQCMQTWDSRVTKERREIIQQGVLLYGVTYSMDARNTPSIENPKYLDCSSFVGQCYWRAGVMDQSTVHWVTGTFASNFTQISESQLIPGDIAQISWNPGGSGASEHIGIYIGTVNGTKYYIHCTGRNAAGVRHAPGEGIQINDYSKFKYFGRCPSL